MHFIGTISHALVQSEKKHMESLVSYCLEKKAELFSKLKLHGKNGCNCFKNFYIKSMKFKYQQESNTAETNKRNCTGTIFKSASTCRF